MSLSRNKENLYHCQNAIWGGEQSTGTEHVPSTQSQHHKQLNHPCFKENEQNKRSVYSKTPYK